MENDKIIPKERAIKLLMGNRKEGTHPQYGRFVYTCPDKKIYPHQWFWDSCFHSEIFAYLGLPEKGLEELTTLFLPIRADGHVGHMNYWIKQISPIDKIVKKYYPEGVTSPLLQPPLAARAYSAVYKKLKETGGVYTEEHGNLYTKLADYYRYIIKSRYIDKEVYLPFIIHPWESGTDNIPSYDPILNIKPPFLFIKWMKALIKGLKIFAESDYDIETTAEKEYFAVFDPLFASATAEGLYTISGIARELGKINEADFFKRAAEKTEKAIIKELWDEEKEIFLTVYRSNGTYNKSEIITVSGLVPLILRELPEEMGRKLIGHLNNKTTFRSDFPIPSTALCEARFKPGRNLLLWRGPSWISTDYLILSGLNRIYTEDPKSVYGNSARKTALYIAERSVRMILKSGFREYYNPFTGEGYGASAFSWSALVSIFNELPVIRNGAE